MEEVNITEEEKEAYNEYVYHQKYIREYLEKIDKTKKKNCEDESNKLEQTK